MRKNIREIAKRMKAGKKRRRQERKNDCHAFHSGPKRRFATPDEAERYVRLTKSHGKPGIVEVFRCTACDGYHIGHKRPSVSPAGEAPLREAA